jgi:hypothetical protein
MSNSINAGDIIREQRQREAAERKAQEVVRLERHLTVEVPTTKAIGFRHPDGGTESYTDQRTGWTEDRPRLVWLPRSQIRLVEGEYEPGREVIVSIPAWLVRKNDL